MIRERFSLFFGKKIMHRFWKREEWCSCIIPMSSQTVFSPQSFHGPVMTPTKNLPSSTIICLFWLLTILKQFSIRTGKNVTLNFALQIKLTILKGLWLFGSRLSQFGHRNRSTNFTTKGAMFTVLVLLCKCKCRLTVWIQLGGGGKKNANAHFSLTTH